MDKPRVIVFGRFPPPADGQSVSTARFVQLLQADFEVTTISSSVPPGVSELKKAVSYLAAGGKLADALSDSHAECVIWPSVSPQVSGHFRDRLAVLPHLKGHRTIAVVHWGSFASVFTHPLTGGSAKKMGQEIDHFVFTDHDLSEACSTWIPASKRSVIANTVDPAIICSDEEVSKKLNRLSDAALSNVSGRSLRLLFLSNMIKEKGYLDVLEAVARLHNQNHMVLLDLVGRWYSDSDRESFDERVRALELLNIVTHHGLVEDRLALKEHYLNADVLVFPTYLEEAQPLCIIEAMNAGVPVISTWEGGIPNMIQHKEQGLLVKPKNPDSIVDAVVQYDDLNLLRENATKARARFLELYHPDVIQARWVDLIQNLHPTT